MPVPPSILAAWRSVLEAIRTAECEAGRNRESVTLVAVSKGVSAESVEVLLREGQRAFAENRIQEMYAKWPVLLERYPTAELRFVGRLQSNKAARAVALSHVIESLDRESVAHALAECPEVRARRLRLLVQVNVGEEPQKGGCPPAEADAFIDWCREDLGLPVVGVMGIPPREVDPTPYFGLLRALRDRKGLSELSMGMSADYRPAVQLGATHVRVGTAVFGPRKRESNISPVPALIADN